MITFLQKWIFQKWKKIQIPKWNEHKLPNGKHQWVSVEIALLNRITFHPNIIPMYEWFDHGEEFVLIFQRPNKHVDFFGESKFMVSIQMGHFRTNFIRGHIS